MCNYYGVNLKAIMESIGYMSDIMPSIFPAGLSAIAAIGSFVTAFFMYRFNKEQANKVFKSNLYSTMVQLAGFVNYVQNLYGYHNVNTEAHAYEIAQQIMHVNKDIIDTTQSFYFNDMFDLEIKSKVNSFLETYIGWKAFRPIKYEEVFLETKNIYGLQMKALQALDCIKENYKNDSKIDNIMSGALKNFNNIKNQCKNNNDKIKYVGNNLNFLFYTTPILKDLTTFVNTEVLNEEEVYPQIINKCFRIFLNGKVHDECYSEVKDFLFYSEFVDFSSEVNQVKKLSGDLINTEGERIPYEQVRDFFYFIIGDIYIQRMNEYNKKS